ncbi:MAG: DUF1223 domain-containing protein [Steroidobacteraceae bacterium]
MKPFSALIVGAMVALAGSTEAAAPAGPIVVELFTSQGCNSCPPADALLGELNRRPEVLALALHVTYWNDLGWKDPFSQVAFDQRQNRYAQQIGRASAYTPQMVVNGTQDVVGSQRDAVNRALDKAVRSVAIIVHKNGELLDVTLPALDRRCDCVLTLFGVQAGASTRVGRGENSGRTLEEFRIVRSMQSLGSWRGEERELRVKPAHMTADITGYAVLAQERITGRMVAAGQ